MNTQTTWAVSDTLLIKYTSSYSVFTLFPHTF